MRSVLTHLLHAHIFRLFKHLRNDPMQVTCFHTLAYSSELDRLFSDTYLPPEGLDARDFSSLSPQIQKFIQGLA
jgi:hypothetical protein